MSRSFPDDPFLRGNFAPWPMEGDIHDLEVVGEIPAAIEGTFYRNGPNPQFPPRSAYHWFDGDGMIHAFSLADGRCQYRNRWVRTGKWLAERAAGEALYPSLRNMTDADPRALAAPWVAANTNVVMHAGKLFALVENAPPTAIDPETLATLGPDRFDDRLAGAMTAHPKLDPETGEMLFFGYGFVPPYLVYHVVDAAGTLVRSEPIEIPDPVMIHDFVVTRDHVVFMICPAVFRTHDGAADPIRWEPDLGSRIGVMPRDGGNADVTWFDAEAFFMFHPMNAWSEGSKVVADVCRYDRLPLFDGNEAEHGLGSVAGAVLTRFTMDLAGGVLKQEHLDDTCSEFPRLDERRAGLAYRMGIAAGSRDPRARGNHLDAILQYDLAEGTRRMHVLAPGSVTGEPIFVPRTPEAPEGDGFVLALVYRAPENRSDLLVLDAGHIEAAPLATVKLPHRIPFGFHGNFAPGVRLSA